MWFVVALVVPLLLACARGDAAICSGRVVSRSNPAPVTAGERVAGGPPVSLADLRGTVTVVNFWASWCGPCRVETPMLADAQRELSGTPVAFLGVDIRDDRAAAAAFESEFRVGYPSIFDKEAAVAAAWNVPAPPTTAVVDANGIVRATISGPVDRADLDCMIATARGAGG